MEDELKPEDLINIREMNKVNVKTGPVIDKLVSDAIGKTVYTNNPILIRKIAEWKKQSGSKDIIVQDGQVITPEADNFLADPVKVEELRAIL